MCYTFLKFSNSARVCNRLGERLCFETSQGICPPTHGGVEEESVSVVVRAAHQAHFTGSVEQ